MQVLAFKGTQKETAPISTIIPSNFLDRVEPPNWWVGFKDSKLQLLVKKQNISNAVPTINYEGVTIIKVHKGTSPNYLFIDLEISRTTIPGMFNIEFKFDDGQKYEHSYELKSRLKESELYDGFNSSDAIYLITPDRFVNADTTNDIVLGLKEKTIDRKNDYARHGGDIKGIINSLDYIQDMGFTAIWSCPLLTNDMYTQSYHGYAMTDFYEVDPRYGTLEDYKKLSLEAKKRGVKLIMDQVANHCGSEHWWMKDLPFKDWVNHQEVYEKIQKGKSIDKEYTISNHKRTTNQDIYASKADKEGLSKGWFVATMPDLNQENTFLATYLIQNNIWWIETLQLGGIRQDTYPYPNKEFMSNWAGAIMNEYPKFSIVGEEWSYNPLLVGYWQKGANNTDGYESNLKSPMDFPMQSYIVAGLNEPEAWNTGLIKLYEGLANDFSYVKPKDIMIFSDNHDMDRIFTQLNEDVTNTKMALGYMLCLPRIPQIYYGTEILMQNTAKPGDHGLIRKDFPGGWLGDKINVFTGKGLSKEQLEMQLYLKKVLNYRKTSKAIATGKTIHFAPENGVYTLFRIEREEIVVVILNKNKATTLDLTRFKELGLKGRTFKNIITNKEIIWNKDIELKSKGAFILTTKL